MSARGKGGHVLSESGHPTPTRGRALDTHNQRETGILPALGHAHSGQHKGKGAQPERAQQEFREEKPWWAS